MLNLTPHEINVVLPNGQLISIPPSGSVARVASVDKLDGTLGAIPVIRREWGQVEGLPEEGTVCIVSALVRERIPGRMGVFSPDTGPTAIRNEKGQIEAVTRFIMA